ncbi:protein FAR1-RELATED SEQUENCE 5-like [Aegilops tauschii subsp. strangulata]|uniref:protein FAR1-RELATED SEQUENCE 5-like n=1 Tax=Aegilops tauschii subsp. strangulata TaxID=200361 RepID=UPI00098B5F61
MNSIYQFVKKTEPLKQSREIQRLKGAAKRETKNLVAPTGNRESCLMEQETGYASDDSGSDNGSSSLNANQPPGDNYMSQDESYSGNLHGNDDDEEYAIDEQFYADSVSQINAHGDNKHNNIDDDNAESKVDASRSGSASQGGVDGPSGNDEHNDDDQFDLDMGYDEYQQESLDGHWEVMAKTFRSLDEVYTFYNKHARERGFSIRKDSLKRSKDRARTVRLRRYLCSAAGKRHAKFYTMEGRTRRLRPESRFFCEAHLTVKLDKKLNLWYVSSFSDDHSHILAQADEVPFLRSHNQIKAFERAEILAIAGAGIRKHIIFDNMVSRYGSYAKSPFQRTKLYNMCYREKMKLLAQGEADTAIGIMLTRKDRDPDFFFEHIADAEGRLQNMFWCDSQSRRDYLDYGDVVVFDSTYKMNRYGMPSIPFVGLNNHRCTMVFACAIVSDETEATYVWLLNTFLKANCQKRPKSVITDGDAAMIRAIRKVLSDVWHRLCSWHIEKNMQKHLNHKSLKEFRALLYYATTHKVFEERWAAFVRKWQTERTKTWLHRMYRKRTLWAASYLSGGFFLGMRSNQRSESLNSSMHLHLDYGMTIIDMIVHYENCIVRLHENEAYDDYTASQTVPVTVTECETIESYAAKAFMQANFYMLQQDMKKVQELEVTRQKL